MTVISIALCASVCGVPVTSVIGYLSIPCKQHFDAPLCLQWPRDGAVTRFVKGSTCAIWCFKCVTFPEGGTLQRGKGLGRCSRGDDEERPNQVLKCSEVSGSPQLPFLPPLQSMAFTSSVASLWLVRWLSWMLALEVSAHFYHCEKKEGTCDKAIMWPVTHYPSPHPNPPSFVTQKATEKHVRAIFKARRGTKTKRSLPPSQSILNAFLVEKTAKCWLCWAATRPLWRARVLLILQGVFQTCTWKRMWQGSVGSFWAAVVKAKCYATKILMYSITVRVCSWINWLNMSDMVELCFLCMFKAATGIYWHICSSKYVQ